MDEYNNYYANNPTPAAPQNGSPRKGRRVLWICLLVVLAVAIASLAYTFLTHPAGLLDESGESSDESGEDPITLVPEIVHSVDDLTIAQIAQKASPSVVEITTESVVTGSSMTQYISSGAGSGVILSDAGYILTNNHVIEGASQITVTTSDGASYKAALVGLDENLDVALLKIEAEDLVPATVASSSELVAGQEVVAIGNPLGQLGGTVTDGIISALNRSITISGRTMNLLQTNAAINPGNSGGGLFDASGNLVGLVVAKYADEEIEGIGFAIPIDDVMAVVDDLYHYGYVPGRVTLGMSLLDITTQQKAWMYRVNRLGVYVYQLTEGGAAAEAGLEPGDCILSFNGASISSSSDMNKQLAKLKVGDTVKVVVLRGTREEQLTLTVGEYIPDAIRDIRYNPSAGEITY